MIRAVTLSLVALLSCLVIGQSLASPKPEAALVYTSAPTYATLAWLTGEERFPAGARIFVGDGKSVKQLVPQLASSADPEISFDGTTVLFAGKMTARDPWQIWEVGIDGSGLRLMFAAGEDVISPHYLPDGFIVYARRVGSEFHLEKRTIADGASKSLSFAPGSAVPTDVLRDGRILFEAAYPLGGKTPEIYTVYSDGSGVESYRCDHGPARFGGRQLSSGDIVFTTSSGLARFTSPLAHQVAVAVPKGRYAGEVADADGEWIVSRSDESKPFELARLNPNSGILSSFANSTENLIQPRFVRSRPVPNRHPSALHEWSTTNLLALNVYTSKYALTKGSIASLRLYTIGNDGTTRVLGTAPVEKDGSFYIKAPGDRPLKFELLDSSGRTVKKQDGWMWARGGEQRICVGCHAGPEHAPENAVPQVLLRSTTPTDLADSTASTHTGGH